MTAEMVIELIWFVTSLFSLYVLVPELILRSSAVVFNLSLLSSDFYTFIVGIIFFKLKVRDRGGGGRHIAQGR